MALRWKTRRKLALLVLFVGLPVYIGLVVGIMGLIYDNFGQPPVWLEFLIYMVLGIACVFPFKSIFRGIGRPDPDAPPEQ